MSEASPVVPGARHTVIPAGITSTAWPKVRQTCRNIGWRFDPWQDATGRLILAKREAGRWAADLSILSIPRQVGKSYLLGCIIFALCLLNPRLRVIWTSHHTATTEEMYESMKELAQHKRVAPHVVKCIALQGSRWRIQFRNGSRIDFGARSQGFGRGKARVGVLVLDEFQHISARALANLAPTTNTADNPLILCAGTPPGPEASGEAFTQRRLAALEGLSDESLYVEFSADRDADADDRRQWAKANPSFPRRTKERAFLLLRKILDEEDFRREALGIWADADGPPIFSHWPALVVHDDQRPRNPAFAVETTQDQSWTAICLAGGREDDRLQVEVADYRPDSTWAIGRVVELREKWAPGAAVVIDPRSPAGALIAGLEDAGVTVVRPTAQNVSHACATFYNLVTDKALTHRDEKPLNDALRVAKQRTLSDAWAWDRKAGNVAALYAATLAAWAARFPVDVLETIW